ncbi:MAG: hypothetical protein KAU28_07910, partial [Phycisphaerae bacterium]|nr:hypothetical protein [Phycisphaerae bacterium]
MKTKISAAVLCLCVLVAPAVGAPPLADRMPAEALVYVGWAGRSLTFDGSKLGQLISEPTVAETFAALKTGIEKKIPEKNRESFEHAWAMAAMAWQHTIAIAVLDIRPQLAPDIDAVLLIDLGQNREGFERHLDTLIQSFGDDLETIDVTVGTVTYKTVEGPEGAQISFGFMGNVFFASLGADVPKKIIELSQDKSLGADKQFVASMKEVAGENEQIAFYMNVAEMVDRVEKFAARRAPTTTKAADEPSEVRRIADALGMGKVTTIAGSVRIADRDLYTKVKVFSPAPHRGLLMPLAGGVLSDADLAGVPADADVAAAIKLSPDALYKEVRRVVLEIEPKADAELAREIANVEDEIGVSLSNDILANLGDTVVLSSAPSQGGFITGTLLTVQVKDTEKLSAAIAKIEAHFKQKLATQASRKA